MLRHCRHTHSLPVAPLCPSVENSEVAVQVILLIHIYEEGHGLGDSWLASHISGSLRYLYTPHPFGASVRMQISMCIPAA
jgi:hypothetical protein